MQLSDNEVHVSCAGSGKTTYVVEQALSAGDERVLITTYTNENIDQIRAFIIDRAGCIPSNITVQSWFSFLLQEGVRPYQNKMGDDRRVHSIYFQLKSPKYQKKGNYFTKASDIYSNKVSEFVHECNGRTKGLIINRLQRMYDRVYLDEIQDCAGYDLNVLEMLFLSSLKVVGVGDPRQATFSTNNAQKNRQHRRSQIYAWLQNKAENGDIKLTEMCDCHRCSQPICDFADKLFPEFPATTSKNTAATGHDGVFLVHKDDLASYTRQFNPVALRYSRSTKTHGLRAINIGITKGRTFKRVLIFPTGPMLAYLKNGELSVAGDKSKLYVAITRARQSSAFVISGKETSLNVPTWKPSSNRS